MKGVFMKIKSQVKSFAKIILFFNLLLFSSQAFTSEKLCELETVVTLQNINQVGYNGRHGVVVGYVAAQGKYKVTLVDNKQTVLVPVAKAIRRIGSKVILHGIESPSHKHLNEKEGTIISYDVESKRYVVQVYSYKKDEILNIQLKEEKLRTKKLEDPLSEEDLAILAKLDSIGGGGSKESPEEVAEEKLKKQIGAIVDTFRHKRWKREIDRLGRHSTQIMGSILNRLRVLYGTQDLSAHNGLNPEEMEKALEVQTYANENPIFHNEDGSPLSCPICLEEFEEGSSVNKLKCPCKSKFFHNLCIKECLKIASSCPFCRSNLRK